MAFLLDDAAFGGQVMVGAGQPVAIGVGPGSKVRGSAFIEAPMQVGKAGAFNSAEGTLMVGQTDNIDCNSPDRSLYVKGDVRIEGDGRSGIELYVEGDAIFSVGTGGKTLSARFDEADSKPVKPFDISIHQRERASSSLCCLKDQKLEFILEVDLQIEQK
jgi:hypothetical protein